MITSDYDEKSEKSQKDLETVSAITEVSLLNSKTSSETNCLSHGSSSADVSCCAQRKEKKKCGYNCCLATGIILVGFGILLLIWTPFHLLMHERLRMLPGLPPFEWWKNPPDEVLLRAYLFNVTNAEAFMDGTDTKLHMQEVGPMVYREKLRHINVTFNDNSTLTYVSKRTAEYLPEMNTIDLNATLILPNYAVLGMASFLYDSSLFTKFGFNVLFRTVQSPLFVKTTVYNYMWNFTDPILSTAQQIYPSLVPFLNTGILARIYDNYEDTVTVYIGPSNGNEKFFLMDKFNGYSNIAEQGPTCDDLVVNSTEGALYHQFITKSSILKYWRKAPCRVIPLYFERELKAYNMKVYKFTMPSNAYDRYSTKNDCYIGQPPLPNGLSDIAKCYNDIPLAISFPHFLYGDEELKNLVTGMKPNRTSHESFAIVEPITGTPTESIARSQNNLIVRKLSGFNPDIQKFSDSVIPMFWLEYNQVGLPYYIVNLVYFCAYLLPKYQYCFVYTILIIGIVILFYTIIKPYKTNRRKKKKYLQCNQQLHFEHETFLKLSN